MTPSADERARARRRALLQRRLLVGARRSERLSATGRRSPPGPGTTGDGLPSSDDRSA